ncbi:MAG: RimK family alpha-L-glutamate ligase [Thaumarchaeota archaeon]|nr:RimK family alpha-L-glutamate ligase [Nitrososphaerota archaeon]MDD9808778.1 RimK family alpha-L-glutamate ligase [Nitrososphaerota archaeon]MDD9813632.1 RimK family alpha-L-glutamate ligase [Nitrososphaerota archaeon]MDD9842598.1 RimK family alpha-L-glutamate ligase [Nitrososphaerota archaeon]RNJ71438.1 MAG: RimK family alpha-L-glutamate ligase [Thaumarchaeota archaeon S14]
MVRISIAYDRLRVEEKMLAASAAELGHEASMLDAKSMEAGTEGTAASMGLGDAVLVRCVSHHRGACVAALAEFAGVTAINSLEVSSRCGNKMFMTLLLRRAGVPTPRTHFALSAEGAVGCMGREGYPLVIKPLVGSWGRGVMSVGDRDTLDAIIESRSVTDSPHDRLYYLQERVERPPRDIRVITVGGEAVAAMYRESAGFRTNVAAGAAPRACEITPEIAELAAGASDAVGGGVLGVDMMEDASRGIVVHEVNNTVEFRGMASTGQADVPAAIVAYAARAARA